MPRFEYGEIERALKQLEYVRALERVAEGAAVCRDIYDADQGDERNFWADGFFPLRAALADLEALRS